MALAIYILCIFHVCASFSALATRKLADAKADSSGIWALEKIRKILFTKTGNPEVTCLYFATIHINFLYPTCR